MVVVVLSDASRSLPGWDEARQILGEGGHEVIDPGPADQLAELPREMAVAEALLVGLNRVTPAVLDAAPRVRVVARPGVGVDNIDVAAATERGIVVCNTPGSNADSVADHTLAMVLALLRNLIAIDARTRAGNGWAERPPVEPQLTGKRVVVLGTGNVGRGVARRMRGFTDRISAYDPYPDEALAAEIGVVYGTFPEVLDGADVVTVHVPLTDETRAMIGADELARLKRGAILIAMSRGGVVDEAALAAALEEGQLGGAGLDVWAEEPCGDSPLFRLSNTVLTPHVAGFSPEAALRARAMTAENIVAALAGRPVNVVNPEVLGS